MKALRFFVGLVVSTVIALPTFAQDKLLITEFVASNNRSLVDEDGDDEDWIEIYNAGTNTVNLDGWYLTDNAGNRTKWRFPATNLLANRYLIVFASNKDRRTPGQPLHTNFRLDPDGEYLGLVWTNGVTVVSEYSPAYPDQITDISYGIAVQQTIVPLLNANAPSRFYIPVDDSLGTNWINPTFNDSGWTGGSGGTGFEAELPAAVVVADSAAEFSGNQGEANWYYGFYNKSLDVPAVYQASNFVAFPRAEGPFAANNYWTGVQWDWYQGNPPWTEIGRTNVHPNGPNNGVEHWAIRRWVSEVSGLIKVDWFLRKASSGGNGVTGRIYHNNTQRDFVAIAGNNTVGTNRSVTFTVQAGDTIDIALDSAGPDNVANDGSDGSHMQVQITTVPSYANLIATSTQTPMLENNATAYIRIPFTVTNAAAIEFLTLRMKYDDGFVAYLNGEHVVSRNAPFEPQWNSNATTERSNLDGLVFEDIDITPGLGLLRQGLNVLAIHGLNLNTTDPDFLIVAEMIGVAVTFDTTTPRYFSVPTPGAANGLGNANLGPLLFNVEHTPNEPLDNEDLVVTASTRMTFNPVAAVNLTYRIMFSNEVTIPMFDDGQHGDGPANDGVYGASIPHTNSIIGDMVRYFVRAYDTLSNATRFPPFQSANNSPQYMGTIVHNPYLTNPLPVLHLFIPNTVLSNNVNNDSVGRYPASIYYLGEFYDNIGINRHGQSSSGFPRRSYDLDFHPGYNFKFDPNEERVDDINLLTTYPDKAKMRNMLSYQIYKDAGSPYHFVYPVRVQHNGAYFADYHIVENGDEGYLERLGLDPKGALYKMYNTFDNPNLGLNQNAEKKTRKQEGNEDLVALWNNIVTGTNYIYDNVNVPQVINFLAARIITGDVDCCHKNYYIYRDSEGTGEWYGMPWDVDLSFGRNWNGTTTYWDDTMYPNNGLFVGGNNRFFGALFNTPAIRQMYLRRVRTLMDELLQAPTTPTNELRFEKQIDYWRDLIAPDAELEKTRWPTFGGDASTPAGQAIISTCCTQSIAHASDIIKTNYLPRRRLAMFNRTIGSGSELPPTPQPSNAVIRIGTIEFNPPNGNQEQEYIQFLNTNTYAVDMSFWSITGAINYTFQGGMVMPANSQMYLSPNVVQFRARTTSPRGGQGLLVQGNYDGQLSARGETVYLVDRGGRVVNTNRYNGNPSLAQQYLRITEIMYHPAFPPAGSAFPNPEDYEFIELRNTGPVAIPLIGVHFKNGIDFTFTAASAVTNLMPGARVLLVKNLAAFTARYGTGFNIAGVYGGSLDNNGETIRLDDAVNEKILDFRFDDRWYPNTDGMGFSLVIVNDAAPFNTWDLKESWRPSGQDNGSPGGTDNPQPSGIAGILVNEVFTHSDPPDVDYIELYNPTTNDVNISGWFISDDFEFGKKYRIPDNTIIPAGEYRVFDETQYNANPALPTSFSFSSKGDEAYVFSGNGTNLTGYFHGWQFGAAETSVSLGRYITSTGAVHFVAQSARTTNAPNALPKVGPVVISEIMYHPPDLPGGRDNDDHEFIELHNITSSPVPLFNTTNEWIVRGGVDFDFPPNVTIPAGGYVILVSFHPLDPPRATSFRAKYNVPASVPLYGPYRGQLDNSGERIELYKPDAPDGNDIPYILVEEVEYSDTLPWAPIADGIGPSLQRVDVTEYGNDAVNWTAVVPTANGPYPGGTLPVIDVQPADQVAVAGFEANFSVQASGTPPLAYQWFFRSNLIFGATSPTLHLSNVRPIDAGPYSVIVYNGAGFVSSMNANLTVLIPASISQQPTNVVLRGSTNALTYGQTFTNATFYVFASSSSRITYQWRFNETAIPDATNSVLVVSNVTLAHVGTYDVIVTDAVRPIRSEPATLSIIISPSISQHPQTQVVRQGDTVVMSVKATGSEPMGFRWRRNGVNLFTTNSGYGPRILTLANVQTNQSGTYTVIITNAGNFAPGVLSTQAILTVLVDTDGDGAPDAWETQFGFLPNNGSDGGMDFDGDGVSNADEFRSGTDPKDEQSHLKVEQLEATGPATVRFLAMSNKTYSVQFSDDLSVGLWSNLANLLSRPTNRIETVTDPSPDPRRYYRIVTPLQDP